MLSVFSRFTQRSSASRKSTPAHTPETREQAEASLALVRELLHAVEQFVLSTPDLDSSRFLHRMRSTAAGLAGDVDPVTMRLYQEWLGNALRAFGGLQQNYIQERETEMWRLLDTYSRATHVTQSTEHALVDQIRDAHVRMKDLVTLPDIRAARMQLEDELQQVQRAVIQKAREDKERSASLTREVARLESVLASVRGQADFDVLTGVFHRAVVEDRLRALLAEGKPVTIALMDVDNFRTINTTLGHAVGDRILALVGDQLQRVTRSTDVAARYGGDEFCFLAVGGTVDQLAQRLSGAVGRRHVRLELDERVCSVLLSLSVGITSSSPGDTLEQVVERAGRALSVVKAAGKGGIRVAQ
ncbi:MAG: putative diguanylate cyclase/phosphodiesterase with sensor [Armatimonadetes bacterium]|jgi:diguanylate cyclase (GGDEF)-like protein|nr:putative diguanylate cyclase/phosphodiesterase with sensor [Armatimonadota bacterium]